MPCFLLRMSRDTICPAPGGCLREGIRISVFHGSILFFVLFFMGEIN